MISYLLRIYRAGELPEQEGDFLGTIQNVDGDETQHFANLDQLRQIIMRHWETELLSPRAADFISNG